MKAIAKTTQLLLQQAQVDFTETEWTDLTSIYLLSYLQSYFPKGDGGWGMALNLLGSMCLLFLKVKNTTDRIS